jgi:hypothetical protein
MSLIAKNTLKVCYWSADTEAEYNTKQRVDILIIDGVYCHGLSISMLNEIKQWHKKKLLYVMKF